MNYFRFRKKIEYGLMMMSLLADGGKSHLVSVRTMQDSGLPRSYLVKIARDLIKARLIVAKEGRGGGYTLAKDPNRITLQDVVVAIDGDQLSTTCFVHGAKKCPGDICAHRSMMSTLYAETNAMLSKYKLTDFGT